MVGKTPGNLRDFRIDERNGDGQADRATGDERAATPASAPRQTAAPRVQFAQQTPPKSSVSEWAGPAGDSLVLEDLWPEWSNEVGNDIDLAKPIGKTAAKTSAPSPTIQVSSPRPASRDPYTPTPAPRAAEAAPAESTLPQPTESVVPADSWAVELALAERRMERSGEVEFANQFHKQELLKKKTLEFTRRLADSFRRQLELFNEARFSAAHAVHMYRVSNTETDFMLYRNGVKLVVSGAKAGKVVFAFNQYMGQIFTSAQSTPTVEIEAHWGAFDQLQWVYKGDRVQLDDLVQYFLSEFARQSFK